MSSMACIFSGQGSQYVGMTADIVKDSESAAERMKQACDIAGFALDEICHEIGCPAWIFDVFCR